MKAIATHETCICSNCNYPEWLHVPTDTNALQCLYAPSTYEDIRCKECGVAYLFIWDGNHIAHRTPTHDYPRRGHDCDWK
jgi:hypothetical protein